MAKSLRSKWRRKCRAVKRERYGVKELARLKKTLGIDENAPTDADMTEISDITTASPSMSLLKRKKEKDRNQDKFIQELSQYTKPPGKCDLDAILPLFNKGLHSIRHRADEMIVYLFKNITNARELRCYLYIMFDFNRFMSSGCMYYDIMEVVLMHCGYDSSMSFEQIACDLSICVENGSELWRVVGEYLFKKMPMSEECVLDSVSDCLFSIFYANNLTYHKESERINDDNASSSEDDDDTESDTDDELEGTTFNPMDEEWAHCTYNHTKNRSRKQLKYITDCYLGILKILLTRFKPVSSAYFLHVVKLHNLDPKIIDRKVLKNLVSKSLKGSTKMDVKSFKLVVDQYVEMLGINKQLIAYANFFIGEGHKRNLNHDVQILKLVAEKQCYDPDMIDFSHISIPTVLKALRHNVKTPTRWAASFRKLTQAEERIKQLVSLADLIDSFNSENPVLTKVSKVLGKKIENLRERERWMDRVTTAKTIKEKAAEKEKKNESVDGEQKMEEDGTRVFNKRTMRDQHGNYPVWMSRRKIVKAKKGRSKGKKIALKEIKGTPKKQKKPRTKAKN